MITWKHRDRIKQIGKAVRQGDDSIGPESGTTYTVEISSGGTVLRTIDSVGIDSVTYKSADEKADNGGALADQLTIEIAAKRDGYASWQRQRISV